MRLRVRVPPGVALSIIWSYSVMVITLDSESSDPGSNPGRTFFFITITTKKKNSTIKCCSKFLIYAIPSLNSAITSPCSVAGLRRFTILQHPSDLNFRKDYCDDNVLEADVNSTECE